LEIYSGNDIGTLSIGNFVSIGPGVKFIPGGGHPLSFVSTFPFGAFETPAENEDLSKGPIVVNDDVWIGAGATILSNVTIGQGAVVAAGAVVTKSVEPYAVVGGSPAKILKYRFPEDVRRRLLEIDWSEFSQDQVKKVMAILKTPVISENVDGICKTLMALGKE
jgi:acetyltransferase-like isoleucine patch superfamily enzyme